MTEPVGQPRPDHGGHGVKPSQGWRAWFARSDPTVLAEQLSVSYGNCIFNSAAALLLVLYVYFKSAARLDYWLIDLWVAIFCPYLVIRIVFGVRYPHRESIPQPILKRWDLLLMCIQAGYGIMLVVMALGIFPTLDPFAQSVVLTGSLVLLGSTAFSFSGHMKAMALSAPAAYLAFAWSAWNLPSPYAAEMTALILGLLALYVMYALKHRRSLERGFALAVQNRELAKELQTKNEQLQEVAAARGRLLATVSHDLRQPAHAIGLLTDRALLEPAAAPVRPILTDLQQLSQSLSASLSTLMDLTRLDAGLMRVRIEPTPLNAVLERLRLEYALMAQAKGLALNVQQTSVWVHSDPVLLHAVLANLLANAIKYTNEGRVDVTVLEFKQGVQVKVVDTGVGIPPDKLDLIFREFVRLDASEAGAEGLGLGLSIVRRYAQLLSHDLDVDSQPQLGSTFSVSLPQAEPAGSQLELVKPIVAAQEGRALAGARVLIIENVELLLSSLTQSFTGWGCRVAAARNLQEALHEVHVQWPDVVVSDHHLGDRETNGLELIQALRLQGQSEGRPAFRVLLMTGDVSAQLEEQATAMGVQVLHKPVRPQLLRSSLMGLMASPLGASQPDATRDADSRQSD